MGLADVAKSGPVEWGCSVTLSYDSPELPRIRALLDDAGIERVERLERTYSDAELRTFPFLQLSIRRAAWSFEKHATCAQRRRSPGLS
jgi:hypothetical protein